MTDNAPQQPPTLDDIRHTLTEAAENHPFDPTALGVEYADWCGTGSPFGGAYCNWKPTWSARNDLDDAREQHIEHLIEEQATAIADLLGIHAAN